MVDLVVYCKSSTFHVQAVQTYGILFTSVTLNSGYVVLIYMHFNSFLHFSA